ncbi:MAG: PfkB family carbohydrate kinase, partial [Bacteroidales bacterium]|nr:PfkB family carbohydrate kinase [Bacteroidales bacterium]
KFLDTMPQEGTLKVFDINLRQNWYSKEVIEESLNRCNILKLNDEEISLVSEILNLDVVRMPSNDAPLSLHDVEIQCRNIMRVYNLQILILTCGTNGSYVFHNNGISFQPTPKVKVADTVGAGDSFTGSFVACLLTGKPIEDAHRTAVQVSAYVCTQNGAMPTIPCELTK